MRRNVTALSIVINSILISKIVALLQCNGVEHSYLSVPDIDGDTNTDATPTDICIDTSYKQWKSSYKITCSSHNKMDYIEYDSSDCSPDTYSYTSTPQRNWNYATNVDVTCDKSQCNLISIIVYDKSFNNINDCIEFNHQSNKNNNNQSFTEEIHIQNYCNSFYSMYSDLITCNNQIVTRHHWYSTDSKCSDTPDKISNLSVGANQCIHVSELNNFGVYPDSSGEIFAVDVSCNVTRLSNKKTNKPTTTHGTSTRTTVHNNGDITGLQCDGIEINISDTITAIPAGVCLLSDDIKSSSILKCDTNNEIRYLKYASMNCSGNPKELPISDKFPSDMIQNIVCGKSQCEYINITRYNKSFDDISQCQSFDRESDSFTQQIVINKYCVSFNGVNSDLGSAIMECGQDGIVTTTLYFDNKYCSDSDQMMKVPDQNVGENQCVSDPSTFHESFVAMDVLCGVAENTQYITPEIDDNGANNKNNNDTSKTDINDHKTTHKSMQNGVIIIIVCSIVAFLIFIVILLYILSKKRGSNALKSIMTGMKGDVEFNEFHNEHSIEE